MRIHTYVHGHTHMYVSTYLHTNDCTQETQSQRHLHNYVSKYIRLTYVVSRLNDCRTFQPQYKAANITDRSLCSVYIHMFLYTYLRTYMLYHKCVLVHIACADTYTPRPLEGSGW